MWPRRSSTGSTTYNRSRLHLEALEDRQLLSGAPIPELNSNLGAPHTLFLDFDGLSVTFERIEDGEAHVIEYSRPAFDMDGDPNYFSDGEVATIKEIWTGVAEDFAPFNINVTTISPGRGKFLTSLIGGMDPVHDDERAGKNDDRSGRTLYDYTHDYDDEERPWSYVFSGEIPIDANFAMSVAGTISHEAGHVLYLDHIPDWDTSRRPWRMIREYGFADPLRTPIMGDNLATDRVMWWQGLDVERERVNEIAVLGRHLGFRGDEANNSFASAQPLVPRGDWTSRGVFEVTGLAAPTVGRYQSLVVGSGIIGNTSDADYFSFDHAGGPLLVQVKTLGNVANLDAKLELYHLVGTHWVLVTTEDPAVTSAFVGLDAEIRIPSAPGGRYVAVVKSHADYGDLGHYTITARVMVPPDAPKVYSVSGPRYFAGPSGTYSFGFRVSFTETIDASTFGTSDVVLLAPSAHFILPEVIEPLRIDAFPGGVNFIIVLPELSTQGRYHLEIGPAIADLTGNFLNQDGDYSFGEDPQDRYVRNFDFRLPPPPRSVADVAAGLRAMGLSDQIIEMALGHWDFQNLLKGLPPSLVGGGQSPEQVNLIDPNFPKPSEPANNPPIQLGGPQPDPPAKPLPWASGIMDWILAGSF